MFEIIKHNLKLLSFFRQKEVRNLPLRVLWQSFRLMQNEKITEINGKLFINNYIPPFPSEASKAYFESYQKIAEGKFKPHSAIISLTNKCNCQCEICFNRNCDEEEMSLEQIKKIIQEIQDLGFFRISLSGGEPTLRKDLEEIISSIKPKSFPVLLTNGIGLTIERAKAFKTAGLKVIKISLDHYKKSEVDKKRGLKGAFDKAVAAIKISKKVGLYVVAAMVITKNLLNSEEIYKYIDFAENLEVDEIVIMEPKGCFLKDRNLLLDNCDRNKLYGLQIEINRNRKRKIKLFAYNYFEHPDMFGCNAGSRCLYIDAIGNVAPCPFVNLSLGNVITEPIKDIYERMKKFLPSPRNCCLFMATKREVENNLQGQFPLDQKNSEEILKKIKVAELPLENKRILKRKILDKLTIKR